MADPETDVLDLEPLRAIADESERMFPGEPDDWWIYRDRRKNIGEMG